jgi:N-acylneuraminate cytidylyltransferase
MKIAIIPARGGSKRIPKKNTKLFHGKPIIAYSIEACIASSVFDKVIVSTDSDEIAQISIKYGAEVPFIRPAELSDDFTSTVEVVNHTIDFFELNHSKIDYVCCVYATAPFLQPSYIQFGLSELLKTGADFTYSATEYPYPIQRAVRENGEMLQPEYINKRSQDLERFFHDAGQFYWGCPKSFRSGLKIFTNRSTPILIPRKFTIDIDNEDDWEIAEKMYKA